MGTCRWADEAARHVLAEHPVQLHPMSDGRLLERERELETLARVLARAAAGAGGLAIATYVCTGINEDSGDAIERYGYV